MTLLEQAGEAQAERVAKINLVIGEASGIAEESVEFYFELLSKDTIASGAVLSFKRISGQARCRNCGKLFIPQELGWSCPDCQGSNVEVVAGNEFYVESIEVK